MEDSFQRKTSLRCCPLGSVTPHLRDLGLPLLGVNYGKDTGVTFQQETLFIPPVACIQGLCSSGELHCGNIHIHLL